MEVAGFEGEMSEMRKRREEVEQRCAREFRAAGERERCEAAVGQRRRHGSNESVVDDGALAAQYRELLEKQDVARRRAGEVGLGGELLLLLEERG